MRYRGVAFDNPERPEVYEQLPKAGYDMQHHPVYWVLPCGRCVYMSFREFYLAKPDQFLPQNSKEAYREIVSELHFDVLGVAQEEPFADLKEKRARWRTRSGCQSAGIFQRTKLRLAGASKRRTQVVIEPMQRRGLLGFGNPREGVLAHKLLSLPLASRFFC